jgi:predicted metal-dependent hydrolase
MRFDFPDNLDTIFIEGEPEESYQYVALSLLLPYLEPYLIRTMRAARPRVTDAALRADLDRFVEQEGQHYRQHAAFNAALRDRGFVSVAPLERQLDDDYRRFTREKTLQFNLAYAEGFEALTAVMACVLMGQDTAKWQPAARDLFIWHVVEELEHRTVAFDVYNHVCGSYAQRVRVGAFAQMHLLRFVMRAATRLLKADPRTLADHGGIAGRQARMRRLRGAFVREILPRALRTFSPRYDPRDIQLPEGTLDLAAHYTKVATRAA